MLRFPRPQPIPPDPGSERLELEERPPVILVPGLCGSRLISNRLVAWPCTTAPLASLGALRWPNDELVADTVIAEWNIAGLFRFTTGYGRLRRLLTRQLGYRLGKNLVEFAYDWRQDCRRSAAKLGNLVRAWKREHLGRQARIVVLAHSMGGLVARYWIEQLGGAADTAALVLIGSPARGAPATFEWLIRGGSFIPFRRIRQKLMAVIFSMPAMYQLLPSTPFVFTPRGEPIDIYADQNWLPSRYRELLDAGREFRAGLSQSPIVPTTTVIGQGVPTCSRIVVDLSRPAPWDSAEILSDCRGDGLVPIASAQLPGSDEHLVYGDHEAILTEACISRLFGASVGGCHHRAASVAPDESIGAAA